MRICVIADVSAAVDPGFAGHGLGQAVYRMAEGLRIAGHDVTLIAGRGSVFAGTLRTPTASEQDYSKEPMLAREAVAAHTEQPFNVFVDNSHTHILSTLFPSLPVVNVYHDIFQPPSRCPVLITRGQQALMPEWSDYARFIPHALDAAAYPFAERAAEPPYALFLGLVRDYKQPLLAVEACALAGMKLKIAGIIPPGGAGILSAGTNAEYVGKVTGAAKVALIQGATVLLQLGLYEAFGLTTIEAGLCGVPVVAWPSGGACDLVEHGVSGAFVPGANNRALAVADTIARARNVDRRTCREHALRYADVGAWIYAWENTLRDVAEGRWW